MQLSAAERSAPFRLDELLKSCLPSYDTICRWYPASDLLRDSNNVADLAFVRGVWVYSATVGRAAFPRGLYAWPIDVRDFFKDSVLCADNASLGASSSGGGGPLPPGSTVNPASGVIAEPTSAPRSSGGTGLPRSVSRGGARQALSAASREGEPERRSGSGRRRIDRGSPLVETAIERGAAVADSGESVPASAWEARSATIGGVARHALSAASSQGEPERRSGSGRRRIDRASPRVEAPPERGAAVADSAESVPASAASIRGVAERVVAADSGPSAPMLGASIASDRGGCDASRSVSRRGVCRGLSADSSQAEALPRSGGSRRRIGGGSSYVERAAPRDATIVDSAEGVPVPTSDAIKASRRGVDDSVVAADSGEPEARRPRLGESEPVSRARGRRVLPWARTLGASVGENDSGGEGVLPSSGGNLRSRWATDECL